MNVWEILGIRATGDEREIKRAYAAQLKTARPDEDPQRFQDLRGAYETALRMARHAAEEPAAVTPVTEPEPLIVSAEGPVYMAAWETKPAPESEAKRLWGAFLSAAGRNPAATLKELDAGGELLDLAVRDCFELCALQYCAGEGCDDQFRAVMAGHFGWEHDCAFIAREMPDETHMMLALLRAHRSWIALSERAEADEATAALLGLRSLSRWKLSDKHLVDNLRNVAREIRWEHGEMLHFRLDRAAFRTDRSAGQRQALFPSECDSVGDIRLAAVVCRHDAAGTHGQLRRRRPDPAGGVRSAHFRRRGVVRLPSACLPPFGRRGAVERPPLQTAASHALPAAVAVRLDGRVRPRLAVDVRRQPGPGTGGHAAAHAVRLHAGQCLCQFGGIQQVHFHRRLLRS
ncbi:J domain-containing protein [Massilia sp. H-1]|nr:J domain-containing protein [Massilia sp. H-1]